MRLQGFEEKTMVGVTNIPYNRREGGGNES